MVSYRPLNQVTTRVTSYSVNNMAPVPDIVVDAGRTSDPLSLPPVPRPQYINMASSTTIRTAPLPIARRPSHTHKNTASEVFAAGGGKISTKPRRSPQRSLSLLLTSAAPTAAGGDEVVYVAFKALPVDTLQEREDGNGFTQPRSDFVQVDSAVGRTCKEVVDNMCAQLVEACDNVGLEVGRLLIEKDIVR